MNQKTTKSVVRIYATLIVILGLLLCSITGWVGMGGLSGWYLAFLILTCFVFVTAWGVWNFRRWSRYGAVVVTLLAIVFYLTGLQFSDGSTFWLGGLLGIVGIYLFLFNKDVKALFQAQSSNTKKKQA